MYIYIYVWSQRVDPKQWIYAIIVLQPFCNLYCAIFAMLCFFLQHFADNIEKQSVFLGFFELILQKIQNLCFFATFCWKYGKTVGSPLFFCTRSAKASQNLCFLHYFAEHAGKRWFSFVSGAHIVKNLECIMIFCICSIQIPIQVPFTTAERPPSGLVS